jgi:hypothetical protein
MAEETSGRRSTQAIASWASVSPSPAAIGRSRSTFRSVRSSSRRWMNAPIAALAAREPAGGGRPGSYFPVSTPWASGLHTIWPMPSRAHSGKTSASGPRSSIEYCGWLETKRAPGSASAARIWAGVHSEKPMARVFPFATAAVRAAIVSGSGVSGS